MQFKQNFFYSQHDVLGELLHFT